MSAVAESNAEARTRARTALERARAFVEVSGDALSIARARALCAAAESARVVELLCDSAAQPSLAHSLWALGILDDLGCARADLAAAHCEWLSQSQQRDGSWCDAGGEREEDRIVGTGMAAGYLAKTPFARDATLAAAADYLAARFAPERVKGSTWATNAAYFHCFSLVRHAQSDGILQWCGRELERGYRTQVYDAIQTARVFVLCRARALPGSRLSAAELVARIDAEQLDDGSFAAALDAPLCARLARTLDAAAALARLV